MTGRVHRAGAVSGLCLILGLILAACAGPAQSADTTKPIAFAAVRAPDVASAPEPVARATPISTQMSAPFNPPVERPGPANPKRDALLALMHEAAGGVLLSDNPALTHAALIAGQAMSLRLHAPIDAPQVVLLVDRSPAVQRLWIVLATPGRAWEALGSVHVSTGKPGRKEHFRTPVGVFDNDGAILGYRALGTYNENHIRGIGIKGMRVWDFGWQTTDDWRTKNAPMAVRMEMHATDPANLELRLGRWDSEGCIRIPSTFNKFLDNSGLIDAKLREAAQTDRRYAALLPKAVPNGLAGSVLVVVDTSDPAAPPSDPVRANAMEHPDMPGPELDSAN